MNPNQLVLLALVGTLLGAAVGFGLKVVGDSETPKTTITSSMDEVVDIVPAFSYPDLEGNLRHGSEWQAKIMVLNFWAAWCPPCREETPLFVELQDKYIQQNVRFVGIAIDDKEPVEEFADTYGVNFPILMGDIKAVTLSRQLGNRFEGLPFTVVVAPDGEILLRHAGGINREQLEPILQQAIENNRRTHEPAARI